MRCQCDPTFFKPTHKLLTVSAQSIVDCIRAVHPSCFPDDGTPPKPIGSTRCARLFHCKAILVSFEDAASLSNSRWVRCRISMFYTSHRFVLLSKLREYVVTFLKSFVIKPHIPLLCHSYIVIFNKYLWTTRATVPN